VKKNPTDLDSDDWLPMTNSNNPTRLVKSGNEPGKAEAPALSSKPIAPDLTAIYNILETNPDAKIRKDAASHLLKLTDEGETIWIDILKRIYEAEKDIAVAAELKRVLNKLHLRKILVDDPTTQYDRKLSFSEEAALFSEIEKLKNLYDRSRKEPGLFDKKYRVLEQIGEGGMGKILKGMRLSDGAVVAIKILLLEELSENNDPERLIARFRREGKLLTSRLQHPHIIKGYEYGDADGEYFIILEYLPGGGIDLKIKRTPLDFHTFMVVAKQVLDAVSYIHATGVIHRDINPRNILIASTEPLIVKLADFGLAKDKTDRRFSRISFTAGTDNYISPQQSRDARDADERDDIFSLGKTFYEMLTGTLMKDDEPYRPIVQEDADMSKAIDDIIRKCIMPRREERWQRVEDVKAALNVLSMQ
jgi:hypothetical protein